MLKTRSFFRFRLSPGGTKNCLYLWNQKVNVLYTVIRGGRTKTAQNSTFNFQRLLIAMSHEQ